MNAWLIFWILIHTSFFIAAEYTMSEMYERDVAFHLHWFSSNKTQKVASPTIQSGCDPQQHYLRDYICIASMCGWKKVRNFAILRRNSAEWAARLLIVCGMDKRNQNANAEDACDMWNYILRRMLFCFSVNSIRAHTAHMPRADATQSPGGRWQRNGAQAVLTKGAAYVLTRPWFR